MVALKVNAIARRQHTVTTQHLTPRNPSHIICMHPSKGRY